MEEGCPSDHMLVRVTPDLGSSPTDSSNRAERVVTMIARTIAAFSALALLAVPAMAQPKDKDPKAKVKVYDFSGDTIEGDLIKPEGTQVDARDFAKHSSLIRIRQDFIAEILKSAEDL